MKYGPILLIAITVAFLFSIGMHWVTAGNTLENKVNAIVEVHNSILELQSKKKELCEGLGEYWSVRLEGICVLPTTNQ